MSGIWADNQFAGIVIAGLLLAYGGELSQPTFHTDAYFELWYRDNFLDYWTGYGRYLSKLVMLALGRVYAPTFLLLTGLAVMSAVGALLCRLWRVEGRARAVLVICFCTFPFFLESFSFTPLRYAVPFGIACAVVGIARGGWMGFAVLSCALLFYQASTYLAAVAVLVWAAVEVAHGLGAWECLRRLLAPKLGLILAAILLNTGLLRAVDAFVSPIGLWDHATIRNGEQLLSAMQLHGGVIASFFLDVDVFLFPFWTKLIAIGGLLAIAYGLLRDTMSRGSRALIAGCVTLLPVAAHGANLALFPPQQFFFERVLFAYAAVYTGIFAIALAVLPRFRNFVVAGFALAAIGFVAQVNVWHEFMALKNQADTDMARSISDRLKADPQYRAGLPLVMVGRQTPTDYLPYRAFQPRQGMIQNTIVNSVYAWDWSKDRILLFYLPFTPADSVQTAKARANAAARGVWPASDSAFIEDGVMTVVLGRE